MSDESEIRPEQSVDLLKALHILTRDGRMNQDSRRKLKQVYHLIRFIEPLLQELKQNQADIQLVDVGAGKSYLGFMLYDLFFRGREDGSCIHAIETRPELVVQGRALAGSLGFAGMRFWDQPIAEAGMVSELPARIDIVTALHACNTATDDAIRFALDRAVQFIVLIPCCQAEVAALLRKNKAKQLMHPVSELWRHPVHTREFGSHVTNVLRCLQLEAHGYQLNVTELVGWEHSMKNELIIARRTGQRQRHRGDRLKSILEMLGLTEALSERFFVPN